MHRGKRLFLSIYVDDFKMAGPKDHLKPMWAAIRKHLDLDPEVKSSENVYLGCGQNTIPVDKKLIAEKSETFQFVQDFVSRPAKSDNTATQGTAQAKAAPASTRDIKINAWQYVMQGHAEQCVDKYLELNNTEINTNQGR